MLRREQDRIGAVLRTIESRQVAVDASLDDWQEVLDLAVRFFDALRQILNPTTPNSVAVCQRSRAPFVLAATWNLLRTSAVGALIVT